MQGMHSRQAAPESCGACSRAGREGSSIAGALPLSAGRAARESGFSTASNAGLATASQQISPHGIYLMSSSAGAYIMAIIAALSSRDLAITSVSLRDTSPLE